MKVSFIFPSWTKSFGAFSKIAKSLAGFPPLNLSLLAAIAEREGHEVQLIDAEIERLGEKDVIKRIGEFSPDIIGMTGKSPMFHLTVSMAKKLKEHFKTPIMVGGPHITHTREEGFHEAFDYLFIDEAEISFPAFLKAYEKKEDFSQIKGIIYRSEGKMINTGCSARIESLDSLPYLARHLLKYEMYVEGTTRGLKRYTPIQTMRGCPFACVYCATSIYGRGVRKRSINHIMGEMELCIEKFGIEHFYIIDDVLTMDRKHISAICNEIINRKLNISFEGNTRANLIDEPLIELLAKAGLIRMGFGLESVDDEVLKLSKKGVPVESYIPVIKALNKHGIENSIFVMLGLPGETRATIESTIDFVANSRDICHASYAIASPNPGTEFYEMAKKGEHGLKLLTEDQSESQRYGKSVISVNGISPEELVRYQRLGLMKIYSKPWRLIPTIKRVGLLALIAPFFSTLILFVFGFFKSLFGFLFESKSGCKLASS